MAHPPLYSAGIKIASTATIDGELNPQWHEQFVFHVCHNKVKELQFGTSSCLVLV